MIITMVAYTFNSRTWQAETGGTLNDFKASPVNIVSSRTQELPRDPVSKRKGVGRTGRGGGAAVNMLVFNFTSQEE